MTFWLIPYGLYASSSHEAREGEVIVVYKSQITPMRKLSGMKDIEIVKEFRTLSKLKDKNYTLIRSRTKSTKSLTAELLKDPDVLRVEPNYIRRLQNLIPNDPDFPQQWALRNIGQRVEYSAGTEDADIDADEAWELETGNQDVVVAVIDTGIDYRHEDLQENMWINTKEYNGEAGIDDDGNGYVDDIYGFDFASNVYGDNDSDPMDKDGHGTMVSGIIGAVGNNGVGISGVAWNVSLMALKVANPYGEISNADLFEAFDYLLTMKEEYGVNIVVANASYNGPDYSATEKEYIDQMQKDGILLVTAAGNEGIDIDRTPEYPASYLNDNIIAVSASDQNDELPNWTNYGKESVDLAAPGVELLTTSPQNGYSYFSGTSAATPIVSGAVAILASAYPDDGYLVQRARLLDNVDPIDWMQNYVATGGRLNLAHALGSSLENLPPQANPDSASTLENRSVTIDVLVNDSDPDGDQLFIESVSFAEHGEVEILSNNRLLYTPDYGFVGTDTFNYTVTDGQGHTASSTVSVVVEESLESGGGGSIAFWSMLMMFVSMMMIVLRKEDLLRKKGL